MKGMRKYVLSFHEDFSVIQKVCIQAREAIECACMKRVINLFDTLFQIFFPLKHMLVEIFFALSMFSTYLCSLRTKARIPAENDIGFSKSQKHPTVHENQYLYYMYFLTFIFLVNIIRVFGL